jgi:hypothetical protein
VINITRLDFIFLMSDRQNGKDCPTVNEAGCYGDDSLLTQFLQLRECHAQILLALPPPIHDSVHGTAPRLVLGFDPPNFPPVMPSP